MRGVSARGVQCRVQRELPRRDRGQRAKGLDVVGAPTPRQTIGHAQRAHDPAGIPTTSIRDYTDYMSYNQSTQGHLNSDGLCFVERHYSSPP